MLCATHEQGALAAVYCSLVRRVWSGKVTVAAPRELKHLLGEFNEDYVGAVQHDAQELLSFLTDVRSSGGPCRVALAVHVSVLVGSRTARSWPPPEFE